jgi:hypothetical protein
VQYRAREEELSRGRSIVADMVHGLRRCHAATKKAAAVAVMAIRGSGCGDGDGPGACIDSTDQLPSSSSSVVVVVDDDEELVEEYVVFVVEITMEVVFPV